MSLMVLASISDIKKRIIPNRLTVAFAFIGLGFNTTSDFPRGVLVSVIGFIAGFLIFLVPYVMKAMGAGDVKLMAAAGAITDFRTVLFIAIISALSGGIIVLISRAASGRLFHTFKNTGKLIIYYFWAVISHIIPLPTIQNRSRQYQIEKSNGRDAYIPYALAIACGSLITIALSYFGKIQGLSI